MENLMTKWTLCIFSAFLCVIGNVFSDVPNITGQKPGPEPLNVRVMDIREGLEITVAPDDQDPPRALIYEWVIVNNVQGGLVPAPVQHPNFKNIASVCFPSASPAQGLGPCDPGQNYNATTAQSLVGSQVIVEARVRFEGETEFASRQFTFNLVSVNFPPTVSTSGNTGSPTDRLPPGTGVTLRGEVENPPSAGAPFPGGSWPSFSPSWSLGQKSGGNYLQPVAFFATATLEPSFTVPNISAPIDQQVILRVRDGLHLRESTITVFMTNSGGSSPPPPTGNQAPTLTVSQSTVTAQLGTQAVLEAIANDVDGDDLAFTWIFLQTNTTVDAASVQTVRLNATQWRSRATIPAALVGTFGFSVQARETNTADQKASPIRQVTLVINPEGGGEPGQFDENRGNCDGNLGPSLVSISPDPRVSQLQIGPGQTLQIRVEFTDNSQAPNTLGPGFVTGVKDVAWNSSSLTGIGLQTSQNAVAFHGDFNASRTLTITAPSSVNAANPQFSVTATDVLDCTTTITTDLNVVSGTSGGAAPTARIRYKFSQGASFSGPLATGATINTSIRTIFLDATQSSVEGGTGTLSYQWAVSGIAGASLSSATAPAPTLTIPQGAEGTATVTLTASLSGGGSSNATLNFNISGSFQPPSAFITSAPSLAEAGSQINLEGDAEAEGGGPPDFVFQWTAFTPNGPVEVFSSGPRANLIAPPPSGIDEELVLTVELRVSLNGVQSQTRTRQIVVTRPRLNFAHVGVGPIPSDDGKTLRLETQMVLVNPRGEPIEGEILFVNNSDGDDWAPLVNGEALSEIQFTIPATGSREFLLTGDSINVGWALLKSPERLVGHLFYRVVEILPDGGKALISEVPILPVRGGQFRTALVPGMSAEELAFSLVNLADHAGSVSFTLTLNSGEKVESAPISLESREQTARFLSEVSQTISLLLGASFEGGTLSIQSPDGLVFAVTLMRSTQNGLPRSILPVAVDSN
jgi:hypothetical protein